MSCSRGLFYSTLGGVWLLAATAMAAPPLAIPSESVFQSFVDTVSETVATPYWQCAPRAEEQCRCVEMLLPDGALSLRNVSVSGDVLRAEYFVFERAGEVLAGAGLLVSRRAGEPLTVAIDEGLFRALSAEDVVVFSVQQVQQRDAATEILLGDLRWVFDVETPVSTGCETAATPHSGREVRGPTAARAAAAQFDGVHWQVEGFEVWPLGGLTATPRLEGRASPGLLPPLMRFDPEGAHLTAMVHTGTASTSLRAVADQRGAGGLGLAYWTAPSVCAESTCLPRALSLDGYVDSGGFSGLHLTGSAVAGGATTSGDGVSWMLGAYQPDFAYGLDEGAFFRSWRQRRLGMSFSGRNYDLYLGGALLGSTPPGLDLGAGPPEVVDFLALYGTRIELTGGARAQLRLGHREMIRDTLDARLSQLHVEIDRPFGNLSRAYLRPLVQTEFTTGVTQREAEGFVAESAAHTDAMVEAALALRGTPGNATHLLRPRLVVGRRLITGQGLSEDLLATSAAPFSRSTLAPFNFAALLLEQRLLLPGFSMSAPLGVVVSDDGRLQNWDPTTFASLRLATGTQEQVVVSLHGLCEGLCSDWGLAARLQWRITAWLRSDHLLGRQAQTANASVLQLPVLRGESELLPLFEGAVPSGFFFYSRLRLQGRRPFLEAGAFGAPGAVFAPGVSLAGGFRFSELGWGVRTEVAALPGQGHWALTLGLSLR